MNPPGHLQVIILAPIENDARLTASFLKAAGIEAVPCRHIAELLAKAGDITTCGALLLAEEALDLGALVALHDLLVRQPSWSEVPVIIITARGDATPQWRMRLAGLGTTGNLMVIERPFRPGTLVSTVDVALRSRRRQFQVRDLLQELAEQAALLREADRRKDEFVAMLAHELRNPLASVSSAARVLQEMDDAENRVWAVDVIKRQNQQLSRLVDDLLDGSRITRGQVELRRQVVDAAVCLQGARDAVAPLLAERRHTLHTAVPTGQFWLDADPARVEQIVGNLLANAARYTEPGGEIWLEVTQEPAHPGGAAAGDGTGGHAQVVICVRDSGIGIPPERIPEMFEMFSQGERTRARSEGGLGIGLTVVRHLCQLHGGSVEARSQGYGHGSTFTVRLPAAAPPATAKAAGPHLGNGRGSSGHAGNGARPPQEGAGRRILLVDDNLDSAAGLKKLLTRRGYDLRLTHDGPSALLLAEEFPPEIVLLDIGLPGMDGYEVARRLRRQPGTARALIIAISGYGQEEDLRQSRESGFDHHLVKPVRLEELRGLLAGSAPAQGQGGGEGR